LISDYMLWRDLVKILKPGDLIEFSRGNSSSLRNGLYHHWAVYMGIHKGVHQVLHYSNENLSGTTRMAIGEISGNVEISYSSLKTRNR
ncbi:hypothetical protein PMAYCL1PPCAC_25339, partial [Pristionchus mayeri]